MQCLTDSVALGFASGTLDKDEAASWLQHLGQCDACRILIAEVARLHRAQRSLHESGPASKPDLGLTDAAVPESLREAELTFMQRIAAGATLDGRYRIDRILGGGGMGVVVLATHLTLDRHVAIKLLHPRALTSDEAVTRFVREAQTAARVANDHVVRVLDAARLETGEPYLAMEYLEGRDARAFLHERGRVGVLEAVDVVVQACLGLGEAHHASIVHRDLKPANLFLVDSPARDELAPFLVKVLDFGVSKIRGQELDSAATSLTHSRSLLGTPIYMSPEQVRASRDVDARADVWALGSIMYELLAGIAPFRRASLGETLAAILTEDPKPLYLLRPEAPADLQSIVMRCLSKDRSARFGAAFELARALEPYASKATREELRSFVAHASGTGPRAGGNLARMEHRVLALVAVRPSLRSGHPEPLRRIAATFGGAFDESNEGLVTISFTVPEVSDLAMRAVRCALAIRDELGSPSIAIVTGFGDVSTRSGTGDTLRRATALLESASGGEVLLDQVTARLTETRFEVERRSRGWSLIGARTDGATIRTLLGKPTRLVGREREMSHLESFLDECVAEPVARAVLVTGAPGNGKSRLCHELVARVGRRDTAVDVWMVEGDPMSAGAPYSMIAPFLKRIAEIVDGESAEARCAKVRARVERARQSAGWDEAETQRIAHFLGEIVGAHFPDDESVQLRTARREPMLLGDQIRRAFQEFVSAECATRPLLIVLDDLHWGDLPSVRLLDAALGLSRRQPFMVVAFARPEIHDLFPRVWVDRGVQEIRLAALTRGAAESLIRHVLGTADASVVEDIVARAEGNAFYLEELVRSVADGHGNQLPETVLAMLQARLESLPTEARRLLRAGAIFGHVFRSSGAAALLGERQELDSILDDLVAREILGERRTARPAEREVSFCHALMRDAAYSMLVDGDRVDGHRAAAEWLESVGEVDALVIAEHYERGQTPERARQFYRRAAEQALEANDFMAAIERADCAMARGATGEERGTLLLLQAEALRWRGDIGLAEERGGEALALLPTGGMSWCRAAAEVALTSGRRGNDARLVATARAVLDAAAVPRDAERLVAMMRIAAQLVYYGHPELAEAIMERVEGVADEVARDEPAVAARLEQLRVARASAAGDLVERRNRTELAATGFRAAGDLRNACTQEVNVAYANLALGCNAAALEALVAAISTAERMGLETVLAVARHNLGLALARLGRLEEAIAVETTAVNAFAAQGDRRLEGAARAYLAWILLCGDDDAAAEREAHLAVELTAQIAPMQAHALAVLARAMLRRGAEVEALVCAQRARDIVRQLGDVEDDEAAVLLVYAETLRAAGHRAEAGREIQYARDRVEALASLIEDRELRAHFTVDVPENARILELAREWLGS